MFDTISRNCYHLEEKYHECGWGKGPCCEKECPIIGMIHNIKTGKYSVWAKRDDEYQDDGKVLEVRETSSFVSQFPLDSNATH